MSHSDHIPIRPMEARHGNCYTRWDAKQIILGNQWIERRWRVCDGRLVPDSILDKRSSREWLRSGPTSPAPTPCVPIDSSECVGIEAFTHTRQPVEADRLGVEISFRTDRGEYRLRFSLFEASAAVLGQLVYSNDFQFDSAVVQSADRTSAVSGVEANSGPKSALVDDRMEYLLLHPRQYRISKVSFRDQTDRENELVAINSWLTHPNASDVGGATNLALIEDVGSGHGLALLKLAPLPGARPVDAVVPDLHVNGAHSCTFGGHGTNTPGSGYAWALVLFQNGLPGATVSLQEFQMQLRLYRSDRDGRFITNTWGDRSQDGAVRESFMRHEIEAARSLHADVVQIDDGWQKGTTANSVNAGTQGGAWESYYDADPDFWSIHAERFPRGLDPLIEQAASSGNELGLWFSPDSTGDYAAWEKDADRLLRFFREQGIRYFKIDGIQIRSVTAERNLSRFFERLLSDSKGEIVCDLDVTAGRRPGYFGAAGVGPIFVENRYTQWGNYWPHHTLRNLWALSRFIHPLRLRMEFLNSERNLDSYPDDPLAPATYPPDYLFATVMLSSPLGWFEASRLSGDFIDSVAALVAVWKQHRTKIHRARIVPVGDEPSGFAFPAFWVVDSDQRSGYLLVFRELSRDSRTTIRLPRFAPPEAVCHLLAGDGSCQWEGGSLSIEMEAQRSYGFFSWRVPGN